MKRTMERLSDLPHGRHVVRQGGFITLAESEYSSDDDATLDCARELKTTAPHGGHVVGDAGPLAEPHSRHVFGHVGLALAHPRVGHQLSAPVTSAANLHTTEGAVARALAHCKSFGTEPNLMDDLPTSML